MATVEYKCFTLTVDANVQQEVEKLLREGWTPVPGVMPVALYHMQRVTEAEQGVRIGMSVDDAGVSILRNGQLIRGN